MESDKKAVHFECATPSPAHTEGGLNELEVTIMNFDFFTSKPTKERRHSRRSLRNELVSNMLSETVRRISSSFYLLPYPDAGEHRLSVISNISSMVSDFKEETAAAYVNIFPIKMLSEAVRRLSASSSFLRTPEGSRRTSTLSSILLEATDAAATKISTRMAPAARSLRKSFAQLGTLDFLIPYECCCGRLTLIQGTIIVGIVELVFATILLMQTPDYLIEDGYLFYTQALVGYGSLLFGIAIFFISTCILVTVLMLHGVRKKKYKFLIPHLVWQCIFIFTQFLRILFIIHLLKEERILRASAIVWIIMCIIPILVQIWFINVVFSCYKHLYRLRNRSKMHEFVQRVSNTSLKIESLNQSPIKTPNTETKLVANGSKLVRYGSVAEIGVAV